MLQWSAQAVTEDPGLTIGNSYNISLKYTLSVAHNIQRPLRLVISESGSE